MKIISYARVSSQDQERLPLQEVVLFRKAIELMNEGGNVFLTCHRCGGIWMQMTPSKWVEYPNGEIKVRKRYPKPKCPSCD